MKYFNKDIIAKLEIYTNPHNPNDIHTHPGLFFVGGSSSGKWTNAHIVLHSLFGESIYNVRKKKLILDKDSHEINVSPHHCEFNDSIFLNCKPVIFTKILKSLGESHDICNTNQPYYILCKNIHLWTNDYYSIIKQAVEKFPDTLRFILTSHKNTKICIELFTTIRTPPPKQAQILDYISFIFQQESLEFTTTIKNKIIQKIKNSVDNDLRVILLWCQEKMISGSWCNVKRIKKVELKHIINTLFSSSSLQTLLQLRDMLIEIITFGKIEKLPKYLLKNIVKHPSLSNEKKQKCISIIAEIDNRMKLHRRNHIHYEALLYNIFHCIHT
jgi:hypothetical protein